MTYRKNVLPSNWIFVVETAVNQVGVDVNTASAQLLQHISGLNKKQRRKNLVTYRDEKWCLHSTKSSQKSTSFRTKSI